MCGVETNISVASNATRETFNVLGIPRFLRRRTIVLKRTRAFKENKPQLTLTARVPVVCVSMLPRRQPRSVLPTRDASGATGCKFQREFFSIVLRQRSVVLNLKEQERLFDRFIFYVK